MNYTLTRSGRPVVAVGAPGSIARLLAEEKLERVFSPGHELHSRIFYDLVEGKYYDKATDLFLTLDEAKAYGVK